MGLKLGATYVLPTSTYLDKRDLGCTWGAILDGPDELDKVDHVDKLLRL